MKPIILALSVFLSIQTFAAYIDVPYGAFKFQQPINVTLAKKFEFVDVRNQAGKDKLQNLSNKGWTCVALGSTSFQCSIFSKDEKLPESVFKKILKIYDKQTLLFSSMSSVSLVNQGEVLSEYLVSQQVFLNSAGIDSYKMAKSNLGPYKMEFQFDAKSPSQFFNIVDANSIETILTETVRTQNQATIYWVQVLFIK